VTDWQIIVTADRVNSALSVVHALDRVVGLSRDNALAAADRMREEGLAAISSPSQQAAESTVARLRGYGLDASVAWSES